MEVIDLWSPRRGVSARWNDKTFFPTRDGDEGQGQYGSASVNRATLNRKVVSTARGFIGLTSKDIRVGDIVVVLLGGQVPFALRSGNGHFIFYDECYIHGMMDGEAMSKDNMESIQTFEIR